MTTLNHYKQFADLFRYPDENLVQNAKVFLDTVVNICPVHAEKLSEFVSAIERFSTKKHQEYYMKTFDVQAICYLDLGYVMFGEDYKRAQNCRH